MNDLHWQRLRSEWAELPKSWTEKQRARARLESLTTLLNKSQLVSRIRRNGVVNAAAGKNCEQMIGELTMPLGVVGPLRLVTGKATADYFVPLATTEGALVASVQRGSKATYAGGGVKVLVNDRGMTRAPVFVVKNIDEGKAVMAWMKKQLKPWQKLINTTSSHLTILEIKPRLVGRNLYLRLRFDTGEAMGMNMVTIVTEKLVEEIESRRQIRCVALSGNGCVDKKAAFMNVFEGRGGEVQAEAIIDKKTVREVLKSTPAEMVEVVQRKQWLGSMASGSMGFNAHYANMAAAIYLATGQDAAHVVEASVGITTAEVSGKDLYFSVWLPNIIVGTVGGGTNLPVQKTCLELLGLGAGHRGEKKTLAAIVAATVLCGELSLTASLATRDLATAHSRLGRGGK